MGCRIMSPNRRKDEDKGVGTKDICDFKILSNLICARGRVVNRATKYKEMATNTIVSAILFSAVGLTLLLNVFIIFNFAMRKRLRIPANVASNLLYVYLAVIDVIGALAWTAPAAYSAMDGKEIWSHDCYLRVRARVFCHVVNAFILAIFMIERLLRIYMPLKRESVHFLNNAWLIVVGISIAGLFIAGSTSFPQSSLDDQYFENVLQCDYATQNGASYFIFTLTIYTGIPFVFIVIAYIAIRMRVTHVLGKRGAGEYAVLKGNSEYTGNGYFLRMKTQLDLLKGIPNKGNNPETKLQNICVDDGYMPVDEVDSSDEDFETKTRHVDGFPTIDASDSREHFLLVRDDVKLTHAYAAISFLYFGLWVPYYIHMMIYTFGDSNLGEGFIQVAVCLIHFGGVLKLPLLLISDTFRAAILKTFCRR